MRRIVLLEGSLNQSSEPSAPGIHVVNHLAVGICLVAAAVCVPAASHADERRELSSAQARTAQYVFVIDDSGSMGRRVGGQSAADPDRLAVFAARSTLSMLDDADEATVVRLNGASAGESVTPIAPLSQNRDQLDAKLALDGSVAAYGGALTPCRRSLEAVKQALNNAYRPNVAQVVMFLTDGECTGSAPTTSTFLDGLKSADDELFKFYLLRFAGRDYTHRLQTLAERTGGAAIEASATDPTAILEPFASALSGSQGYESYLLSPSDQRLDAHKGARRVRLLAVAPDKGEELSFSVDPARKGQPPEMVGAGQTGLHQYEDGRRYRYAAIDYRPGTVPVTVDVDGAGDEWKVVAVPEYRLYVTMDIRPGRCDDVPRESAEAGAIHYAEVGSTICGQVRLINEDGQVVTSDVASRGTEALVRYGEPKTDNPHDLPANRRDRQARFTIERANLERGDHIFRPVVRLSVPGQQGARVTIKGAAQTLQVSSLSIDAHPKRVDFGSLVPGSQKFENITIGGNFPPAAARLVVQSHKDLPDCVCFGLSGKAEGASQKITPGQGYTLGIDVAPYCGASSFKRTIQTAVRIEFDPSDQLLDVPSLVVPVDFSVVSKVSAPDKLTATLPAGGSANIDVAIGGNFTREARFEAVVPPIDERARWPADADDLDVMFVGANDEPMTDHDGRPARATTTSFTPGPKAHPLRLRAVSDTCCAGGAYLTEVALVPSSGNAAALRMPVEVTVEPASAWGCWGPTILWVLLAILGVVAALYMYNMFRQSSFLSKADLSNQLELLEWGPTGQPTPATNGPRTVASVVDQNFTFGERARAWLAANPLKLGLPNDDTYDETVRLVLNTRQPRSSQLKVLGRVDHYARLANHPRTEPHVYVSKNKGFYGVPNRDGYIGSLRHQTYMSPPTGELEVVPLRGADLVVDDGDRSQGQPAGWHIGY